jgi:hypothetical protein
MNNAEQQLCENCLPKDIENQLHEQYAINDNERKSSFITFIVGIVALFGFYGYVFVYTYPEFSSSGNLIHINLSSINKTMLIE